MEVWTHRPQGHVVESLEWLTDIIACKAGEKRASLRPLPRMTLTFDHQFSAREYGLAREKARLVGGDPLYVPEWQHLTDIPGISAGTVSIPVNAAHIPAYKVGGSLLLWEDYDHFEVCSISAIGSGTISISATVNNYDYLTVAPLREGTFAQPFTGKRPPAHYNTAQAVFVVTATEDMFDASATPYLAYKGKALVTSSREGINDLEDTMARELDVLDSKTGPLINYPKRSDATLGMSVAITAQTAAELLNLRSFLATLRGRWKSFWLPSWNHDLEITANIVAGNNYVQVSAIDFANTYGIGSHLVVVTKTGGFIAWQVASVSTEVAGSERLHFTGGVFSGGLDMALVDRVCLLTLSRLDADRIELQYLPGLAVTVAVPTVEVPA